jgi:predicted transcriptional regulator
LTTRADIPAVVLQFLEKRIDTVPELETLLIVSGEPARAWSVAEIAALTYVSRESALGVLRALERQRLVSGEAGGHFRFSPADETQRQIVEQTAIAYRTHLVSIATFIHRKAATPVQEFARAFSLKKDD